MRIVVSINNAVIKLRGIGCKYDELRKELDSRRYFATWRPATETQDRKNDYIFLEKIANWIEEHKLDYLSKYVPLDDTFKKQSADKLSYSAAVAPFLTEVMLGATMLTLLKITKMYTGAWIGGADETSVKHRSALARVLFEAFGIEKVSDLDSLVCRDYLISLSRFINTISVGQKTNASSEAPVQWHPSCTNDELLKQLSDEIGLIERVVASPSDEGKVALRA